MTDFWNVGTQIVRGRDTSSETRKILMVVGKVAYAKKINPEEKDEIARAISYIDKLQKINKLISQDKFDVSQIFEYNLLQIMALDKYKKYDSNQVAVYLKGIKSDLTQVSKAPERGNIAEITAFFMEMSKISLNLALSANNNLNNMISLQL